MTETRNYHREIVEERDRLKVERDELLRTAGRLLELGILNPTGWDKYDAAIAELRAAVSKAEVGKS
jgi:hypothetical protein